MLISPQGMPVNQVFRAHLVSQARSVPKVSQVPTQCPSLPCPGGISEVQALGSPTALIHSSRVDRPRERPLPRKESLGVRIGAVFLANLFIFGEFWRMYYGEFGGYASISVQ